MFVTIILQMFQTSGNESYFIVRDFIEVPATMGPPFRNVLYYPLQSSRTYQVQVCVCVYILVAVP